MGRRMQSGHNSGQKKEKKRYQITTDDIIKQIKHGTPLTNRMIEVLNEESLITFINDSIPTSVLKQAEMSKKDIVHDIYRLIVGVDQYAHLRERAVGNLAGVVGHVWANKYFKRQGYKVANEVSLYDSSTGEKLADTDIVLTDSIGRQVFIELKTAFKLGVDGDTILSTNNDKKIKEYLKPGGIIPRALMQSVRKETMLEVTTSTGNNALRQLKANTKYILDKDDDIDRRVALCVYKGVEIYPKAREKISEFGEIIELPLNIYKLYAYCFNLVGSLIYYGRNMTNPPRGQRGRTFEERYDVEKIDLGL